MTITILLLILVVSFTVHIFFIVAFVQEKKKKHLYGFMVTAFANTFLMGILAVIAFKYPFLIQTVDLKFLMWVISGLIAGILLALKIAVGIRVYLRTKDPENYHLNFFGKKVYHPGVIKKSEYGFMLFSIPFFLLIGSYFVARLINLILYGHL